MYLVPGMIFKIDGLEWEFSCSFFDEAEKA